MMKSWITFLGTVAVVMGVVGCGKDGGGKKKATTPNNNNQCYTDRYGVQRCDNRVSGDSCRARGYTRNGNQWYDQYGNRVTCNDYYDDHYYVDWDHNWGFPIRYGEWDRCRQYYGGGAFTVVIGGQLYCMAPHVIPVGY